MDFNPNTTGVKGAEILPYDEVNIPLDASHVACMSWAQTTGQVVQDITIGTQNPGQGNPIAGGTWLAEVYDNETAVIDQSTVAVGTYVPTVDVSGVTALGWTDQAAGTSTIYTTIDETTLDLTDYIKVVDATGVLVTAQYSGRTSAATLTGDRILAVTLTAVVSRTAGYASRFRLFLDLAGTRYYSPYFSPAADQNTTITYTWLYQPASKRPWRIADIDLFKTASTDEIGIEAEAKSNEARCYQLILTVPYCAENRIAVGTLNLNKSDPSMYPQASNMTFPMTTPTGGAWTKDATGRHLLLVRRLLTTTTGDAYNVPATILVREAPSARCYTPTLNGVYGYVTAMGSSQARMFALVVRTTAPAISVDSQPYGSVSSIVSMTTLPKHPTVIAGTASTGVALGPTTTTKQLTQEFSNAAPANYSLIRTVMSLPSLLGATDPYADDFALNADPTDTLTFQVRRASDNVAMGGSATLTVAQLTAATDLGTGWRVIELVLSSVATLTTATQYYIDIVRSGSPASTGAWLIAALYAVQFPADTTAAGFGGTTDASWRPTRITNLDIPITLSTQPTVPANFTVTLTDQTVPTTVRGATKVRFAALAWTATSLSASFLRYEIERSEDGGTTYTQIATISTEATVTFNDYQSLRGVAVRYRLRVVRTDYAYSTWATGGPITCSCVNDELVLVSNASPTLNVAVDYSKEVSWAFLSADERIFRKIYGRDNQVSFQPTEARGVSISFPVTINAGSAPTAPGLHVFDAVRALAVANLAYVTVMDHVGNRIYAALQVPAGTQRRPSQLYVANIIATSVITSPPAAAV